MALLKARCLLAQVAAHAAMSVRRGQDLLRAVGHDAGVACTTFARGSR
jgi:hypothetical protein